MDSMIGERIRQTRQARRLSLNDVAARAKISVATLSRIERDKQGLELGLFLSLCRVLKTSPRDLLVDGDGDGNGKVDPLAVRIASLNPPERVQLWHDLAATRRGDRRTHMRAQMRRLADEFEELMAQIELVRAEMESLHSRMRRR
jgi:transcriptional regulator with XRE-family HTH domain